MIALIAHDRMKDEMFTFVSSNIAFFRKHKLVSTKHTAERLREAGLDVTSVPHGPMGGDLVIGNMIVNSQVKVVFFFRDVLSPQPHEHDVSALLRACDLYSVLLATNPHSAVRLLAGIQCFPTF